MSLHKNLYLYCKEKKFEELSCILQFAIVSYLTSHKSKQEWIYLSPEILNSFTGIGEENIVELFEFLFHNNRDTVAKSYRFYCPEESEKFCCAKDFDEIQDSPIELDCHNCNTLHITDNLENSKYEIDYLGHKERIIEQLQINNSSISKELVILSTNEEHIDKLANIIVSRLTVAPKDKEEAKKGIVKIFHSVKDITGLISGITSDVSETTSSLIKIAENLSGVSTITKIFKE
jgi:hypothetical protein